MSLRGKHIFWVVAVLGTVIDLWTKTFFFQKIEENNGTSLKVIEGFFYISHALNHGGVFGYFADYNVVLTCIRAVALLVIVYAFLKTDSQHRACVWALGFLFAGACGNLYDNLFNDGAVRDWLDFYLLPPFRWRFATFNLADVFINIGVGLLIIHEIKQSRIRKQAASNPN